MFDFKFYMFIVFLCDIDLAILITIGLVLTIHDMVHNMIRYETNMIYNMIFMIL